MGRKIDLTNKVFGALTVIKEYPARTPQGSIQWVCKCKCGNTTIVSGDNLRRGHTLSCGCLQSEKAKEKLIDLTGKKFGHLIVVKVDHKDKNRNYYWLCQCDCGKQTIVLGNNLKRGNTTSCGCHMNDGHVKDLRGQKFGKLTPIDYFYKNNRVYWNCLCDCGNKTVVQSSSLTGLTTQSCGCINYSIGERNISSILDNNHIKYIKEYSPEDMKRKLRFDFYLPEYNRLIEFDGKQHFQPCGGSWDKNDSLEQRQKRDKIKNEYAINNNIQLVRIPYQFRDKITLDILLGEQFLVKKEEG